MIRSLYSRLQTLSIRPALVDRLHPIKKSSASFSSTSISVSGNDAVEGEELDERFAINAFMHHGQRRRYRNYNKFDSPRKRANKIYHTIIQESMATAKAETPRVWEENFRISDAVELEVLLHGGKNSTNPEDLRKIRGVILGIFRRKMDYSILIRDVVSGSEIERMIPLHNPMVKSLKVLQQDFVFKGTRKPKRAKLYYLSDRSPAICQVTGVKFASDLEAEKNAAPKKKDKKKKKKKKS